MSVHGRNDALAGALLLIVAAQAALFLVAAGRGLDLTDESFYLLTFQHWTEWPLVSLFGAYFAAPFALVGHSIWAIRGVGFALLLGAAVWFSHEVNAGLDALARRNTRDGLAAASVAGGGAIWSYYGAFVVPYTPSYNLLTLACALLAMAMACRLGRAIFVGETAGLYRKALALGLIGSVGIASKFSAGVLVLGLSALVVCAFGWRRLEGPAWLRVVLALTAGVVINLGLLWLADPELPVRFQRGIAVTLAVLPRNLSGELLAMATVELPKAVAASLRILMWPLVVAAVAFAVAPRTSRPWLLNAGGTFAFITGALVFTFVKDNRLHRIVLMTLIVAFLALAMLWLRRGSKGTELGGRAGVIGGAVLATPFAYSFGTNNTLLWHMGMAAIFPSVLAVSQLRSMWLERSIPNWVFAVGLALLTALPAEIVVRQWMQGEYTYRLGAPLAEQNVPMPPNPGRMDVRVAPPLARGVGDFLRLVQASGFVAGQPVIDFTGQAPGLVAVCGGVPLGAIWIVGGGPFDGDNVARLTLQYLDAKDVRRAWLLTSRDSFARIGSWAQIMKDKLGAFAHEEVGHVTIPDPTSNDKTKTIEVTLWRPTK